ncbi:65-kDa microtubule-associated protein 6-like [Zingiber officinale]|uniref:65-kDa microtubule-associated protein 6-like n=1 Tax=Zingiber officinale TaxID=94328 RepID=UPI001C4B3CA7|nr:65-kDa microtubule-associated protein 6-like [Zingiber officinale]XP_042457234.1 65-kDa microtubule-associated protein 6-like [Zingiber officinale]XP_042457235.1 65-kDa microtubule-associated protein 6-like [Zingiber officinale]
MAGGVRTSISLETTCGALLQELEQIWTEIGESEEEKDQMLLELEKECMKVYQKKVEEARTARARLHQSLVAKEAELASLTASLGEQIVHLKIGNSTSLKEKLGLLTPLLEDLTAKKEDRIKQFSDLLSQIEKLNAEIVGFSRCCDAAGDTFKIEEHNLSTRKLAEYQAKLRNLQKEKSDRLHKVMEQVNEVHSLCGVLGMDFRTIVEQVHPSLYEICVERSTNISDTTIKGLSEAILKLKAEKKMRTQKLQDAAKTLSELWNLMNSSEEDRKPFEVVMNMLGLPEVDVTCSGVLSMETIKQIETEIDRLTRLKVGRMKELVLKKRSELEEICINTHIEPDVSTTPEKVCALLASCLVDPSELLANIEAQITKVKEESTIRKEIIDRVNKWLLACEEEDWLEEYDKDANKYSVGRGAHLNLKRAEKARVTASKIPAIVNGLTNKVFAWEDERNSAFLYDGVRLVSLLEEYKLKRQLKEEEKRRDREHKKLQNLLLTEKEAVYGSKPTPKRSNSLRKNGNGNGFMTPSPRRNSVGSATPEVLTPRSHSGRYNSYFKETRRLSAAVPLNFVAISKEDAVPSFASVAGSVAGSPPRN